MPSFVCSGWKFSFTPMIWCNTLQLWPAAWCHSAGPVVPEGWEKLTGKSILQPSQLMHLLPFILSLFLFFFFSFKDCFQNIVGLGEFYQAQSIVPCKLLSRICLVFFFFFLQFQRQVIIWCPTEKRPKNCKMAHGEWPAVSLLSVGTSPISSTAGQGNTDRKHAGDSLLPST